MKMLNNRKGMTPVVATMILVGVVLTVGINVWYFANSVSSGLQTTYREKVRERIDIISERFIIEHISYNNTSGPDLTVWVYNIGEISRYDSSLDDISIQVEVYVYYQLVEGPEVEVELAENVTILSGELSPPITATLEEGLSAGTEVTIKVVSLRKRENVAYKTYVWQG